MARSRFSNVEEASNKEDVRLRKNDYNNDDDSGDEATPKKLVWWISTLIFLAILALIIISAWMIRKNGSFSWKDQQTPVGSINYHGLLMIVGFVLVSGVGDILYRMCRASPKLPVKIAHSIVQLTGFAFVVSALCGSFWYHDAVGAPHLRSTHSWIGLTLVLLMSLQWTIGFLGFLLPGFKPSLRNATLPVHQFTGNTIFLLSVANILSGLNKVGDNPSVRNCLALVLILYAINGAYILRKNSYARDSNGVRASNRQAGYAAIIPEIRRTSTHSNRSAGFRDVDQPEAPTKSYINVAETGRTYQSQGLDRFEKRLEELKQHDVADDSLI